MSDTATDRRDRTDPDGYLAPDADALVCAYCGAPFTDDDLLALHHGLEHEEHLTDEERTAFADAYEAENEAIRLFRLKALAVLVVLYFGLLMAYSVFA